MNSEPLSQYIYGVIPAADQAARDFIRRKIADGIGRNGIKTIFHEDVAAVISPGKPADLGKMRKDDLAQLLIEHQKIIEKIMDSAIMVIPFRLGTYLSNESEVAEILANGRRLINRIFIDIAGRIEMDVVATWADFAAVLKETGEEDEIKKCKTAFVANPRGISIDDQMKIGLMIKQALDRRRSETSRRIFEKLSSESCAQSAHENMDDRMLLNGAFLIERMRRTNFERVLDELDAEFSGKLELRCVGPLAPYSFYTLELKKILWEDVDWARSLLGLGDIAAEEEIKTAFLKSVKATHPDHCGQDASADAAFKEIDDARRILLEYAQACSQSAAPQHIFFNEENVRQNSLLVKVRNG